MSNNSLPPTRSGGDAPAFPTMTLNQRGYADHAPGLTKREALAGLAMMGLLAGDDVNNPETVGAIARMSVNQADALLAELAKREAGG